MRKKTLLLSSLCAVMLASAALADSNGTVGVVTNSETQVLSGSFDHGADPGSDDNSTVSATFTGLSDTSGLAFDASQILIEGDATGQITFTIPSGPTYFINEAGIVVTDPTGEIHNGWSSGLSPQGLPGPFAYSQALTLTTASAAGTWQFEFFDREDDGAGADTISENVSITLQEKSPNVDPVGVFGLNFVNGTATSEGEFLQGAPRIWDEYPINVTAAGSIEINTFFVEGLAGREVDSVIGLFGPNGLLIAQNDDRDEDFFSRIIADVDVGTYTIVVTGVGGNIVPGNIGLLDLADIVGNGDDIGAFGDYGLTVTGTPGTITGVSSTLLGDVNLDGTVSFLDISPFISVLSGTEFQAEADCNEDGEVDFLDISPFISILSGA